MKDRFSGQPKLNCRNWECGVIVPITTVVNETQGVGGKTASSLQSQSQQLPVELFHDTVPVPLKIPGADLTESRPPWFFQG